MWTRKSVKQKGKSAFQLNFWKCVLVALILSAIVGASNGFSSGGGYTVPATSRNIFENVTDSGSDVDTDVDTDVDFNIDVDGTDIDFNIEPDFLDDNDELVGFAIGSFIVLMIIVGIISLIIAAFALAVRYLLMTPFEYGCRKFFRKNLDEPAKLSNIVYVFDSHYKNIVKTAFLRDLFIWLWSLLFVIPGIIKSYEYRLVPYIVSENPMINYKDALAESKKLMKGNKWKTFVLDLSFIGWDLLSLFTMGMLEIFFVGPYKASTEAALYESIKYGIDVK